LWVLLVLLLLLLLLAAPRMPAALGALRPRVQDAATTAGRAADKVAKDAAGAARGAESRWVA
jgi:hypothetical protein